MLFLYQYRYFFFRKISSEQNWAMFYSFVSITWCLETITDFNVRARLYILDDRRKLKILFTIRLFIAYVTGEDKSRPDRDSNPHWATKCHREENKSTRDTSTGPLAYCTSTLSTKLPCHLVALWHKYLFSDFHACFEPLHLEIAAHRNYIVM